MLTRLRRTLPCLLVLACASTSALATYCSSTVTSNCTPGGMVNVDWSIPGASSSGVTSITFPFIVTSAPNAAGYFFAQQFFFNGSSLGGYIGVQPGANALDNAHFSIFGSGTSAVNTTNCSSGADSGDGVTCSLNVPMVMGHQYNLTVYQDGSNQQVWHGTIVDYTQCQDATALGSSKAKSVCAPVEIGSWNLGAAATLQTSSVGFVEYYESTKKGCAGLPYADAQFLAPTTSSLTGQVGTETTYGACGSSVNFGGSTSTHGGWVRSETGW